MPVTTAETYNIYLDHPALFGAVDQVYVHIYPFWNGVGIDRAVTAAGEACTRVEQKAGGKSVVVAETGWPSAGEPNGAAVPSAANAERYFREFTAWAKGRQVPYFYFEAFDEAGRRSTRASAEPTGVSGTRTRTRSTASSPPRRRR